MHFKIRTKLITAFIGLISVILGIAGGVAWYNQKALHKAIQCSEDADERMQLVNMFQIALSRVLMPGNDYIITGDRKYVSEFETASYGMENGIKMVEESMAHLRGSMKAGEIKEEEEIFRDVKAAWQNIKDISLKIFEIQNPQATVETQHAASLLMEEMDYKWAYPAVKRLDRLDEISRKGHREGIEAVYKAWRRSWFIMGVGALFLFAAGISFALLYSRLFVGPIEKLHSGADAIARGEFKTRLDIKTGDEIEQLSNAMNKMAEQLDAFTANLQGMVEERTRELEAMLEASQAVMRQKGFVERARAIFDISKGLIGASAGYVALTSRDGTRNELLFLDTGGRECTVDRSLPMPIRGLREQAYKTGKAVYDNDFSNSEWMRFMPEGHVSLDNVLFAPLMKEGNSIGLIGLANKPGGFNDNDARLLTAFGDIAAIALMESMADDALVESEDRYRVLGKTAPNAIICLKVPDTVTFWNRRAEEIFGYSEEEVIGKPMHGLIVPERYREKAGEGMKNFFKTGTGPAVGKKTELSALRRDGTEFPIELSLSAMNVGGEWQATGIVRDITDRKLAEEALRHERDLAQTYLNIAGVIFMVIDSNEKVSLVNKKGTEVLGCPEGEIIGKNWFENFLPERVRDEVRGVFGKLIRGEDGSLEYVENPVLTCSGEERIIAWHNTALKDEAGNIIATLSSGEDITESRKAEEKLKQRIDELEQFRKVTIKRELRMEELQRKVEEMEKKLGIKV